MQIGAATCILGKIGYGSVSESLVHGKPFIFVRRDFFNEEPFLRKQLEIYGLAVEIKRRDFLQGNWHAFLQHASTLKSTYRYTAAQPQRLLTLCKVSKYPATRLQSWPASRLIPVDMCFFVEDMLRV